MYQHILKVWQLTAKRDVNRFIRKGFTINVPGINGTYVNPWEIKQAISKELGEEVANTGNVGDLSLWDKK